MKPQPIYFTLLRLTSIPYSPAQGNIDRDRCLENVTRSSVVHTSMRSKTRGHKPGGTFNAASADGVEEIKEPFEVKHRQIASRRLRIEFVADPVDDLEHADRHTSLKWYMWRSIVLCWNVVFSGSANSSAETPSNQHIVTRQRRNTCTNDTLSPAKRA